MRKGNLLTMNWKINSQYGQEKVVTRDVERLLALYSIDSRRIEEVTTAVSEACLNALEHGNKLDPHRLVEVTMDIHEGGCIFRFYDDGAGFDSHLLLANQVTQFIKTDPRGWGLQLINTFANQFRTGYEDIRFYVELVFLTNDTYESGCGNGTIISR